MVLCLLGRNGTSAEPKPESRVLMEFSTSTASRSVRTNGNTAVDLDSASAWPLRARVRPGDRWPGLTVLAPQGGWNLGAAAHVMVPLRNPGSNEVRVFCRVDNPGANGTDYCVSDSLSLAPGTSGKLKVELRRTAGNQRKGDLFGMRGYPVAPGGPGTINPSNVTQILLFVDQPTKPLVFEVGSITAGGVYTPPTAWVTDAEPFLPFIDTFGQYRHKDWPDKVRSPEDLTRQREAEARALDTAPGPGDRNEYGGWQAGPRLRATGFFRAEKHQGQWWLVDPSGRLFWSHGIDCVRMMDVTPIEEREAWFADFPGRDPELAEFVVPRAFALKGHYAGRSPACFSFGGANLRRKYGPEWKEAYPQLIHRRLRAWGLNTIGMWSDEATRLLRRTPYVDALTTARAKRIEGSEGYWGRFADPFDTSFRETLRRSAESKVGKSAGDPWCLGFFCDNELSWGDDVSLAVAALRSPPSQPAKQEFIATLRTKYDTIQNLNRSWGAQHAAWDALAEHREAPDLKRARPDLEAFYTRIADAYFRGVREAIEAVAPQQLYLGCRFAWVNARAAVVAAKYCHVVSYNLYRRGVADYVFNGGADVPLIIGEFHFGALDRGMFHTGLVPVASQAERAVSYRSYVEGALRHPQFVGCHWFQYMDEPTTGRVYDEENYQIGFVSIADVPYAETVRASQEMGEAMYRLRSGGHGIGERSAGQAARGQ